MKVLHVPYCYYPDAVGGTEVYVSGLARSQRELGLDVEIAAPWSGRLSESYVHDGIPVHRFATGERLSLDELYGGDPAAALDFGRVLDTSRPSLVHLHSWTSAVSMAAVAQVVRRGLPLVFSYHTPAASCVRGTLLLNGEEICDGRLEVERCTACVLRAKSLGPAAAALLAKLPAAAGQAAGALGREGGAWTAFRMSALLARHQDCFRQLTAAAQRIVVPCLWAKELFRQFGAAFDRVRLCRQGAESGERVTPSAPAPSAPVRVAFFGRADATKGIAVLLAAREADPELALELDFYAVAQSDGERAELAKWQARMGGRLGVRFLAPVPAAAVRSTLAGYHYLAVPSQSLETGPLVVYEAFAAGVPVLGSNLGGIAELIEDGKTGLLVEAASIAAWAAALQRVVESPGLSGQLARNLPAPRTMRMAAQEHQGIYAEAAA